MKIIAVVVTYNRLPLLQRTVNSLRANKGLERIIIVNNDSTDGTRQWLDTQSDLEVIHQANVGGAGGFRRGMKRAHELGADWIWCMDDDVFPRPDCLENLVKNVSWHGVGIMSPRRLVDGHIFTTEFQAFDLQHTFASTAMYHLSKIKVNHPVEIAGAAFEGLFIKRDVVDAIGYPNDRLFIFFDDTDYCIRALQEGFKLIYVPAAVMDKENLRGNISWLKRQKNKRWKRFYQVRNEAWFLHRYGKTWGVRHLRSFNSMLGYMIPSIFLGIFTSAYKISDPIKFLKVWHKGHKGQLGKMG